jgi:hypothetical protein
MSMRTPGRCTNLEACWLANGGRDVWVAVGDEFVCPVCGAPLKAPTLHAISMRSLAAATAASLVLVGLAGGAGFGLVRGLRALPHGVQTAMLAQRSHKMPAHWPVAAPMLATGVAKVPAPTIAATAAPQTMVATRAQASVVPAPAPAVHMAAFASVAPRTKAGLSPAMARAVAQESVAQSVMAPVRAAPLGASPMAAAVVAQAMMRPQRPLVLPISFGRPVAPEDDQAERSTRWHHHAPPVRHTGFLPGPGWTNADEETISQASAPYAVAEGDDSGAPSAPPVPDAVPAQQADTGAPGIAGASGADTVPSVVPQFVPQLASAGGAVVGRDVMPVAVTRLTVPAMVSRAAYEAPAERVDAAVAEAIDESPDASAKLARLPAAAPARLALPAYPAAAEAYERPGQVNVGCTITVRGEPANCAVTRHVGGHGFAESVLTWLHSGSVRYRPHLVQGRPVPEPHLYDVKFEP